MIKIDNLGINTADDRHLSLLLDVAFEMLRSISLLMFKNQ